MDTKANEIQKMMENIIWHINTNRDVLGDKHTLDDVQQSLNNTVAYLKRIQEL